MAPPPKPGLSPYAIRELANWYEGEGDRRRVGLKLDQKVNQAKEALLNWFILLVCGMEM